MEKTASKSCIYDLLHLPRLRRRYHSSIWMHLLPSMRLERLQYVKTMKIIYNNLLPLPGYSAMMLFGMIFARKRCAPLSEATVRHEEIHRLQAIECGGYLRYYTRYFDYWLRYGYKNNPFEREAYCHMYDKSYVIKRTFRPWETHLT